MKDKKEKATVIVRCEPNGCRCNICGRSIPEGDFACDGGHVVGDEYSVPVSTE